MKSNFNETTKKSFQQSYDSKRAFVFVIELLCCQGACIHQKKRKGHFWKESEKVQGNKNGLFEFEANVHNNKSMHQVCGVLSLTFLPPCVKC